MKEIVVDTSVWISALRGTSIPLLEEALKGGRVLLPPLVLAELISGTKNPKEEAKLTQFLSYIPLHPVGRSHWRKVGILRAKLASKGFATSIPDCHVAQCCLEAEADLLTLDKIFAKISSAVGLRLIPLLQSVK